jgi:hypothetical protein
LRLSGLAVLALAIAAPALGQGVPANVQKLAAAAGVASSVVAWCGGELRPGRRGDVAIAASSSADSRYLVVGPGSSAVELAPYAGRPELSCYSPAQAVKLDRSIRDSETIHGQITPRWRTTVICGFVEETRAVCWQYSPAARAFLKVGEWIT